MDKSFKVEVRVEKGMQTFWCAYIWNNSGFDDIGFGWADDPNEAWTNGYEFAQKYVALFGDKHN